MKKISIFLALITLIFSVFLVYKYKQHRNRFFNLETITLATKLDPEPFSFFKDNTISGFDIDIAREVTLRLGKPINLKSLSWKKIASEVSRGRVDLFLTARPYSEIPKKLLPGAGFSPRLSEKRFY